MMRLNNYQLKSELGQGGMAIVYLAHDNKFNTGVAIKVLNKEFVQNENIRKRFLAEARNMFKMSHPNIIKVTDLIEEGDTVAFVMEYIEGETLKDYIDRKGKLSDEEIKSLFSQMLEAVGYVHKQQLVHRDIKPSNFIVTPEGQVKLMDFGIAKTTNKSSAEYTHTVTGVQMGTPMYMSPEQVKNSKEVTYSTDIYSLGVVLWQMVSGQKPYNSNTLSNVEIHIKILQESLEPTGRNWDKVIFKALEKEPSSRFSNAVSFKNALEAVEGFAYDKTIPERQVVQYPIPETQLGPINKTSINHATEKKLSKKYFKVGLACLFFAVLVGVYYSLNRGASTDGATTVFLDSANAEDSALEDITRVSHPNDAVAGDFNGDGKLDYMWLKNPQLSPDRSECIGNCISYIMFDDPTIPSIEVFESIGGVLSNHGDLNKNGKDEIGLLPDWFTSCWRKYHVWTFKNGGWINAVEPFPIHCNQWEQGIKPIEIDQNRIGNVVINYSEYNSDLDDIVTLSKSINFVK